MHQTCIFNMSNDRRMQLSSLLHGLIHGVGILNPDPVVGKAQRSSSLCGCHINDLIRMQVMRNRCKLQNRDLRISLIFLKQWF